MKKKTYVAPETEMRIVELEQGFMRGSVIDKDQNTDNPVTAGSQEIEGSYDFSNSDPWEDHSN